MQKKYNINKIKKILFKEGYYKLERFLNDSFCKNLIKELVKEHKKLQKNKFFKDEASQKGQIIIRDLILRNPKKFLHLIDLKIIIKILDTVFDEPYILDNCMASNSVNVKKKT